MALAFLELLVHGQTQVNVLTAHNDTARTGQNLNETILTPSNVNPYQFGKLFSHSVNGVVFAQPLYVSQLNIPNKGAHDVVYVTTAGNYLYGNPESYLGDAVYAFDADTNGGSNANPLWSVSLLTAPVPLSGENPYQFGVVGTPVIDGSTNTMYVVDAEMLNSQYVHRLHALDITTGAEKFGGPVQIQGSVAGTGSGSANGTVVFNDIYELQRSALLLQNHVVYASFGSVNDEGPWHGWVFSYNAATLQQIDVFCTSPNGTGAGIWMGGAGLAGEINNPSKPFGRMFFATGNGSFGIGTPTTAGQPYSNATNSYGMSMVDLDLNGGVMTVSDAFSPYNEALLSSHDADFGSGGPLLLPSQALASGKVLNSVLQIGKPGLIYVLDRDNNNDGSNQPSTEYSPAGLGGFNQAGDQVVQEVQSPVLPGSLYGWGAGVWGAEAYWNNSIYSGGTNPGASSGLTAYSFVNGVLSGAPTSQSPDTYGYPGPTPSISASGNTNGIVWTLNHNGAGVLEAYDATNLANLLYTSAENASRDYAGTGEEYTVPTIANGKVYVTGLGVVNAYGLLVGEPTTPSPVITPGSSTFSTPVTVSITDAIAGATIYYTTDGTVPTTNSTIYQSANPPVISTNRKITAIASAAGYLQSAPASVTYTSATTPATPVFSLIAGTYTGTQTLTITETTPGAVVYYTVDGGAPTSAAVIYTQPLVISASQTVQAVAISGPYASSNVSAAYIIQPAGAFNFSTGFAQADGPIQFNGSTDLDDFRLQLTNGGANQAGSAFYATPVNIQQFTTTFTFQLSNPQADGITFTIQKNSASALGGYGGQLGYGGIPNSVAIKFDLYNNVGEGSDSTGLYINGAIPTVPAIDLTQTGIDLHDGDYFDASLTYDGANLSLTLTDAITAASWSHTWVVNIPQTIGSSTAFIGFTGGTGGLSSSQKLTSWTYVPGSPAPSYGAGFAPGSMTLNGGAALIGTSLELTDGNPNEARSAFFNIPVNIQQFSTNFRFQLANAAADGFTFTIQGNSPTVLGGAGSFLGYHNIPHSLAIKFDLYSNAGEGPDSTGLYLDGAIPTIPAIDLSSTGINFHSGDVFNVQLSYDGITLTVIITDTFTNASATQTYTVDVPAIVGGPTAYVGFTGSSGGGTAIQQILNWTFSPLLAASPAFFAGFSTAQASLALNGSAVLNGSRLRLTDGNPNEAASAFFTTPVNVQKFATSFDFQLTNAQADGFTFTIQGVGPTILGGNGGYLGTGFAESVTVKFDLFSNGGEGPDSTGLFTDGVLPTVPAINLLPSGVDLHSGDIFNAQLTYNGTILTVVVTDKVTNASATHTYTVDIPSIVGAATAYVGFTAGTGGESAIQEILDWNYGAAATN